MNKRQRTEADEDYANRRYQILILEKDNAAKDEQIQILKCEIAAKDKLILKLEKELRIAEGGNSSYFPDGESFLETGPTPILLHKALERVNMTSSNFTKLLMSTLSNNGVPCSIVARSLKPSVILERDAHTKFVYQALVCKVLFADFENDFFNIEDNALGILDPEQSRKENFQRYKYLQQLENPEELVHEDATNNEFRRFCIKKREDLITAVSHTEALVVRNLAALLFGQAFEADGIRRQSAVSNPLEFKTTSTFVRFAFSVFIVHKLAFSLHPNARIFRVQDEKIFDSKYMESVVPHADDEDDIITPNSISAGFTVVPGFQVNKIVVKSRVYTTVKKV